MISTTLPRPVLTPRLAAPTLQSPPVHDITVKQAVTAVASAVTVAGIEGVGNTVSSLSHGFRNMKQAYKTLFNTQLIGPVLKTSIGVILPLAAVASPVLTCVGSIGWGLVRGFTAAIDEHDGGFKNAVKKGVEDVKYFHKDLSGKLITTLQEYETEQLPAGQKPFDISIVGGAKGLVGGLTGMAVDGAGIGLVTLGRTPQGVYKAYHAIWTDNHQGPVLKTTESLLVPLGAVVATPLAIVVGGVYGLATGFQKGYSEGLGASVEKSVKNVSDFHKAVSEALKN